MSSMFKKPKKNLRQRTATSDDEADSESNQQPPLAVKVENASAAPSKPASSASKPSKPAVDIKKKTSTLSFQEDLEEDEGIETFQIKKSSQSRRIAKKMERDRKLKEQEQKMSGNTQKAPEKKTAEESAGRDSELPPTPPPPKDLILSGREAEMAGYRSESEEESSDHEGIRFRKPDPFRNVLESRARNSISYLFQSFICSLTIFQQFSLFQKRL